MTETINSKQIKIAKRYASAISKLDDRLVVLQDLYNVLSTQKTSQDLKEFLENPVIKKQDKKEVKKEVSKVVWPSKKNMVKYSIAVISFILFFSVFFYVIELIMALLEVGV